MASGAEAKCAVRQFRERESGEIDRFVLRRGGLAAGTEILGDLRRTGGFALAPQRRSPVHCKAGERLADRSLPHSGCGASRSRRSRIPRCARSTNSSRSASLASADHSPIRIFVVRGISDLHFSAPTWRRQTSVRARHVTHIRYYSMLWQPGCTTTRGALARLVADHCRPCATSYSRPSRS